MNSCVLMTSSMTTGSTRSAVTSNPGGSYSWSNEGEGKLKLTGLSQH